MSDTTDTMPATEGATTRRKSPGLSGMVLAELQTVASGLGITGTTRMRKGELIEAIREKQGQSAPARSASTDNDKGSRTSTRKPKTAARAESADEADSSAANGDATGAPTRAKTRPSRDDSSSRAPREGKPTRAAQRPWRPQRAAQATATTVATATTSKAAAAVGVAVVVATVIATASAARRDRFAEGEPQVSPDDVLVPVAGIVDVLDSYAFVRTSGYLPGSNDVYISLSQVRATACAVATRLPVQFASRKRASVARSSTPWSGSTPSMVPRPTRPKSVRTSTS